MLSNAYFLAKFRFDTAENEPAKKIAKFTNFANPTPNREVRAGVAARAGGRAGAPRPRGGARGRPRHGRLRGAAREANKLLCLKMNNFI